MTTLDKRKQIILNAIIQEYLATAEPVGSSHVCKKHKLSISPATIRNEMAELEEKGYIKQPHTSAGRIPSDKGYRYYVDNLMKSKPLSTKEESIIRNLYKNINNDTDAIIHQTLTAISSLTHYAAMLLIHKEQTSERIYHYGISQIASQPEFNNAEELKQIVEVLEEEALLSSMLKDYSFSGEITIKIGSENKFKEIKDYSVVVSPYKSNKGQLSSIGIIGPTRMTYNKTSSIINYVCSELSSVFEEIDF